MFRNRRLACLILGIWLGAAALADVLVAQNFATVDRFLAVPGSPRAVADMVHAGAESTRFMLRRNAADENSWIFENWGWVQIVIGVFLFLLILLGDKPPKSALVFCGAMLLVLVVQLFLFVPQVETLGREVSEIPVSELANSAVNSRFWLFHGFFSGSEILKLLVGAALGVRLMIRRERAEPVAAPYDGVERRRVRNQGGTPQTGDSR